MAAGNWIIYSDFKATSYKKKMDLTADTVKVILVTSSSNAINANLVTAQYATVTNEVANGLGYTTGGATATTPAIAGGGAVATTTFTTDNVTWTASGGSIVARAAVMYDNTSANKDLIAYCLLDSTPADVTVPAGVTLTLQTGTVFSAT